MCDELSCRALDEWQNVLNCKNGCFNMMKMDCWFMHKSAMWNACVQQCKFYMSTPFLSTKCGTSCQSHHQNSFGVLCCLTVGNMHHRFSEINQIKYHQMFQAFCGPQVRKNKTVLFSICNFLIRETEFAAERLSTDTEASTKRWSSL